MLPKNKIRAYEYDILLQEIQAILGRIAATYTSKSTKTIKLIDQINANRLSNNVSLTPEQIQTNIAQELDAGNDEFEVLTKFLANKLTGLAEIMTEDSEEFKVGTPYDQ